MATGKLRRPNGMQQQSARMRKHMYRLPFTECVCGARQVFKSYQPEAMGWALWCYVCGRKDGDINPPESLDPVLEALGKLTAAERRAVLAELRAEAERRGISI